MDGVAGGKTNPLLDDDDDDQRPSKGAMRSARRALTSGAGTDVLQELRDAEGGKLEGLVFFSPVDERLHRCCATGSPSAVTHRHDCHSLPRLTDYFAFDLIFFFFY